jgi:hypothetical protein
LATPARVAETLTDAFAVKPLSAPVACSTPNDAVPVIPSPGANVVVVGAWAVRARPARDSHASSVTASSRLARRRPMAFASRSSAVGSTASVRRSAVATSAA